MFRELTIPSHKNRHVTFIVIIGGGVPNIFIIHRDYGNFVPDIVYTSFMVNENIDLSEEDFRILTRIRLAWSKGVWVKN